MRSVVVVLPASMWAMIPMFRVFSRVNLRGMVSLSRRSCVRLRAGAQGMRAKKRALGGPDTYTWSDPLARGLCLAGLHVKVQARRAGYAATTTGVTPRRQSTIARGFGGFEGVRHRSAAFPGGCRAVGAGDRRDPREARCILAAGAGLGSCARAAASSPLVTGGTRARAAASS